MADGGVGSVFLDLVVRDTVDKQVQALAEKAQATTQKSFAGMEQAISAAVDKAVAKATKAATSAASSASRAANQAADAAQKAVQAAASSATSCGQQVENTIGDSFSKSVAIAQAKVAQLEKAFDAVTSKLDGQWYSGAFDPASKATQKLLAEQEKLMAQLEAAQDRLAIEVQAAAQKRSAAEAAAAQKAAAAQEREAKKAAAAQKKAAQAAAKAHEQSAARVKNAFSKAFSKVKTGLSSAGKSVGQFGTRLKSIISGALVFNLLSSALRKMTDYLGTAVNSSSEMKDALANLKGAAMTAAQPIVEMLTPALTALANGAATVLSYLTRLTSYFTGKTVASMSGAAKKIQSTAGTAKKAMASLAGFDEIQKLDSNDSSGGGGGSADVMPNFDFQGQSSFLDSVMESVKAGNWGDIGALLSKKLNSCLSSINWPNIQKKASSWVSGLAEGINGFISGFNWGKLGTTLSLGLSTAISTLRSAITTFDWASLGKGIADAIDGIDWVGLLGDLAGGISDILKAALDLLIGFAENLDWGKLGSDLWNGLIGIITNIDWGGIISKAFQLLGAAVGGAVSLIVGFAKSLWESLKSAFEETKDYFATYIDEAGGNVIQGLLNGIGNGLKNIGTWIKENIFDPFINGFKNAFDIHSPSGEMEGMGDFLIQGLFQGISNAWTSITTFFTDAFKSVKKTITEIWEDGILPAIKGPINSIIGFINGMISGICEGINTIIKAMNKLKWDIPDWVPLLGGKTFGFNLKTITAPQIPMLANGGVITQPTLAMMGEYAGARNNPEIAAPQSLIEQTLAKVMADYEAANLAGHEATVQALREILAAVLGIEIGDTTIGQAANRYNQKMAIIKGGL